MRYSRCFKVWILMKKYNLFCPIRKANPYRRMAKALKTNNVADNILNREFTEHGPRKILLTDITYIPYNKTRCYLSTIIDAFTKEVLAYVLSKSLEIEFVLEIDISKCKKFEEVKEIIDDWIWYYNNERYQWNLAKLSPIEYYNYYTTGEYPIKFGKSKNRKIPSS